MARARWTEVATTIELVSWTSRRSLLSLFLLVLVTAAPALGRSASATSGPVVANGTPAALPLQGVEGDEHANGDLRLGSSSTVEGGVPAGGSPDGVAPAVLAGGDVTLGRRAAVSGDVHANEYVTLEKESRIDGDLTWTGSLLVNRGTVTGTAQQAPKRLLPSLPSEADARAAADRTYEQSTDFTNAVIDDVVFVAGKARILGTIEGRGTLIAETIVVEPEAIFTSPPFPSSLQVTLVSYGDVIVGTGRWLRGTVLAGGNLSLDAASLTGSVAVHGAVTLGSEANIVFESFDETPPVITDRSPADGSVVPGATVEISAAWSDDVSGIDLASAVLRVDDVDRTAEATVTTDGIRLSPGSPWSEGAHAVDLFVADLAGNATTSSWGFGVDTVPPQLAFTEPTEPVVFDDPAPRIVLAASDATSGLDPSTLELVLDGSAITDRCGVSSDGAVCYPPVLQDGEHMAAASVQDLAGHMATATLTFETRQDLAGPEVVITSPTEGEYLGSTEIVVTGQVEDDSGVAEVRVNGQPGAFDGDQFQATVTSGEGPVVLQATAVDVTGKEGFAAVVVTVDTTSPTIELEHPTAESVTNHPTVRIEGRLADSSPVTSLTLAGEPMALDGNRFAGEASLVPGQNLLTLEAVDAAGNVGRANASIEYFYLPAIEITAPPDLATLTTTTVHVEGTVDDPSAAVDVNGVSATLLPDGRFTADGVPLVEGGNVLAATVRTAEGSVNTASVHVVRDLTAPNVEITTPPDGAVVTVDRVAVSGLVNDLVAGTVNAQEATVTVNGVATLVRNRNFLVADIPLVPGENLLTARAVDESGNIAESTIRVRRESAGPEATLRKVSGDLQEGVAQTELPAPLVVAVVSGEGVPLVGRTVLFEEESGGGRLAGDRRRVAVTTDSQGQAATPWTLGRRAGVQRVRASAVGVMQTLDFLASAGPREPAVLVVDAGDQQLGTAGHRLPRPFIATVTDDGYNRLAGVPVEFSIVKGGGTFAGEPTQVVTTDSDGRAVATLTLGPDEGNANNAVLARIVGVAESPEIAFTASGRAAGPAEETAITGVVLDNTSRPIEGVTVRVDDTTLWATTDAAGQFRIEPAPVGDVFLIVDGSTTERPGIWASLEFRMTTISGRENDLGMPIFLLPLDVADGLYVDEVTGGTVTAPDVPGLTLEIEPGSVTFPGGSKSGVVSITTVHSDRVPMVPNFGQQPRLIVTIQPAGARFDPPAKITYPNIEGLAPGESTDLYSFDHDLGHFVSIGPGTVSDDGTVLVSDPGVGILKAGWHCGGDPQGSSGTAHACSECEACNGGACVPVESVATGSSSGLAFKAGFACEDDDACTADDECGGGRCNGDPITISGVDATGNGLKSVEEVAGVGIQFSAGTAIQTNCEAPLEYNWNFGDSFFSQERNPVHAYAKEGTYAATLRVKCPACAKATMIDSVRVEISCPEPQNFRTVRAGPNGFSLEFIYSWDSSTGDVSDLDQCQIWERVDYPSSRNPFNWPNPPWVHATVNPTENPAGPMNILPFQDLHDAGGVDSHRLAPAAFSAHQKYYYKCKCYQDPETERILQSGIILYREVYVTPTGEFRMKIEKDGHTFDFALNP